MRAGGRGIAEREEVNAAPAMLRGDLHSGKEPESRTRRGFACFIDTAIRVVVGEGNDLKARGPCLLNEGSRRFRPIGHC